MVLKGCSANPIWDIHVEGLVTPCNRALAGAKYLIQSFENEEDKGPIHQFFECLTDELVWPAVSDLVASSTNANRESSFKSGHHSIQS